MGNSCRREVGKSSSSRQSTPVSPEIVYLKPEIPVLNIPVIVAETDSIESDSQMHDVLSIQDFMKSYEHFFDNHLLRTDAHDQAVSSCYATSRMYTGNNPDYLRCETPTLDYPNSSSTRSGIEDRLRPRVIFASSRVLQASPRTPVLTQALTGDYIRNRLVGIDTIYEQMTPLAGPMGGVISRQQSPALHSQNDNNNDSSRGQDALLQPYASKPLGMLGLQSYATSPIHSPSYNNPVSSDDDDDDENNEYEDTCDDINERNSKSISNYDCDPTHLVCSSTSQSTQRKNHQTQQDTSIEYDQHDQEKHVHPDEGSLRDEHREEHKQNIRLSHSTTQTTNSEYSQEVSTLTRTRTMTPTSKLDHRESGSPRARGSISKAVMTRRESLPSHNNLGTGQQKVFALNAKHILQQ